MISSKHHRTSKKIATKSGGQRQLKVGEEIRHALSRIFIEEVFYEPELKGISVTVSEVRVTPDLKHARVFVSDLGGKASADFVEALNRMLPKLRYLVTQRIKLRFSPEIYFVRDESFDNVQKINELLKTKHGSEEI